MSYYHHTEDPYPEGTRSRSPDYTRGGAAERRGSAYYAGRPRSPSPYGDRYGASRSPYASRYGAPPERDAVDRSSRYDRYDRERDYDEPASTRPYDEYERERERDRYDGPEDRYRRAGGYGDYSDYSREERPRERNRAPDGPIPDPMDSPALLPFKQFAHVHRQRQARLDPAASTSDLTTQEMFNLYKRYKVVYTARSARRFWEEKRDMPFFAEKYSTAESEVERRRQRRRRGRQGRKSDWLQELREGAIDGVSFEMQFQPLSEPHSSTDSTIFSRSGEPIKITSDSLPIEPCPNQLLVMRIPPSLSRREIEAELSTYSGFQYLAQGEAHANKQYYAIAWAVFQTEEDAAAARTTLGGSPIVSQNKLQLDIAVRGAQVKFRSAPSGASRLTRLAKDLRQSKALLQSLQREDRELLWPADDGLEDRDREAIHTDASVEISRRVFEAQGLKNYVEVSGETEDEVLAQISEGTSPFVSEDEKAEVRLAVKKQLDLHLDILRQAYHCDYYSSTVCDFAEELDRRSRAHFRRVYPAGETEVEREGRESEKRNNGEEGPNMGEEQWAENLDRKHALLLGLPTVDIEDHGGVDIDKLMLELATPFTRQDDKEKHRCVVEVLNPAHEKDPSVPMTKTCDKLFRALVFVQKHVYNKHRDVVDRELGNARRDDITYLNNYIRDPTRVMPPLSGALAASRDGRQDRAGAGRGGTNGSLAHTHAHHSWDDPAGAGEGTRMGLIRMGASSFAPDNTGRGGSRRRSASPPLRGDRTRGGALPNQPPPIHLGGGGPPPRPLHLRLGGVLENGDGQGPSPAGGLLPLNHEPLPPAPRPLDPRAARGREVRSYQDLDTSGGPGAGDGSGEVMELEY